MPLTEGLKKAKSESLTSMVVIHKSWCGSCKNFAPKFSSSSEIARLSSAFVMINVHDDEEPIDPKFAPDGQYYPRIVFLDHNGKLMPKLNNGRQDGQFKYLYTQADQLENAMKKALRVSIFTQQVADVMDAHSFRSYEEL